MSEIRIPEVNLLGDLICPYKGHIIPVVKHPVQWPLVTPCSECKKDILITREASNLAFERWRAAF